MERLQETRETRIAIQVSILKALACYAQDKMDEAVSMLEKALSLGEPEGYILTFVDEGSLVAELLSRIIEHQQEKQQFSPEGYSYTYARVLLAAFQFLIILISGGQ